MPVSEVFRGDCMEFLRDLPDKSIDLVIDDPPYFSGPEKRNYYGREFSNHGVKRIDYKPLDKSWVVPTQEYYDELKRVSHNQIIWGCNYFDFKYESPGRIVWDKVNDHSSFSDCEIAYCSFIKTVKIFRYMWAGMMQGCGDGTSKKMQGNKELNEKKFHPTQKPVPLYKWCLKKFAKPGDKILDCHLGSQSSRIAAFDMGYNFIGYELDQYYFDEGCERFNKHKSQLKLFP